MSIDRKSLFTSTSLSFAFWGVIATLGPLVASGSIISGLSHNQKVFFLLIGPITVPAGNVIMGFLADKIGRRSVFTITMLLYSIGIVIISLSYALIPLAAGLILAEFGVGGEEPSSLSLIAEETKIKERPMWLTIITNFNNIGSALTAALFFVVVNDFYDRIILLVSSLTIILSIFILRHWLNESSIWKKHAGTDYDGEKAEVYEESGVSHSWPDIKTNQNEENEGDINQAYEEGRKISPSFLSSYIFLGIIGISQYLTFGLMAYVIAPVEFPSSSQDNEIIFVALLGASVAGFFAAPLVSGRRKNYTLYSFMFGFITMLLIILLLPYLSNMVIFLPLLFANMFMSEFAWASRSVLEPELFSTKYRSTSIGFVRLWPMIAYPVFTYLTSSMNLEDFLITNAFLWGMGFAAALFWYGFGVETYNATMDY